MFSKIPKDPEAVLDYKFAWGADSPPWLDSGETIASATVDVPTGLTLESQSVTDDGESVLVWLSGGTIGATYLVECTIVTTKSRTDVRRMPIYVKER
jgi:hypothetical protein